MANGWVFSPRLDLLTFGGSALLSLGLLALGLAFGWDEQPVSPTLFVGAVVLVDVAHVWSTSLRTYCDRESFTRHKTLYLTLPLAGYVAGLALYSEGPLLFWRAFAYLAVFHFVRQQSGWVKLARLGDDATPSWLDALVIHSAAFAPIAYWHAHLPRAFDWFITGDFLVMPEAAARLLWISSCILFVISIFSYIVLHARAGRRQAWGKHLVVSTTIALWWLGIVVFDSDYAFTVTNVFAHGIPYLVLIAVYARRRSPLVAGGWLAHFRTHTVPKLLGAVWLVAWLEELLWDRTVWHDHPTLFGASISLGGMAPFWVPLLALPQLTHYALDGFIWRRSFDPWLKQVLASRAPDR